MDFQALGLGRVTKTDWQGEAAWPRSLPHCACSRPVPAAQPPLCRGRSTLQANACRFQMLKPSLSPLLGWWVCCAFNKGQHTIRRAGDGGEIPEMEGMSPG